MNETPLTLDLAEVGGVGLYSTIALAMTAGRAVRLLNVRAGHRRAGLLRRHVALLRAAAELSGGIVSGAEVGSQEVLFQPSKIVGGEFVFRVGAGACVTPFLQALLPPLLTSKTCKQPTTMRLFGSLLAPNAYSISGWSDLVLPLLRDAGAIVELEVERFGTHPRGGGQVRVHVTPVPSLRPIDRVERGPLLERLALVTIAGLPFEVAEREMRVLREVLGWEESEVQPRQLPADAGLMNAVTVRFSHENATEHFFAYGLPGRRAESVAEDAAQQAKRYLADGAASGSHLGQVLLPFLATMGGDLSVSRPDPRLLQTAMVVAPLSAHPIEYSQYNKRGITLNARCSL